MIRLKTLLGILFFVCIGYEFANAQQRSVPVSQQFRLGEGLIRIAEPGQLADSVSVWGDINTPGRYLIPRGTRIHELISYARGPASYRTGDTTVDWSKLRIEINITSFGESNEDPVFTNFTYRYSDPIPDRFYDHTLKNSDIIGVEVKRRPSFADYVRVIGPAVSAIATTFIIIDRL
ncbi:hypothetical protein [Rhodohalobacter barkolensis]|uniref:Soluble ligand binding domain-containing protein n=1 Tax=Rhodohalobacter barkolensis TaxID=2053187 RepID=A0A2N0VKD5_9BACT|nr:hypothetical protein [Rhodohalobacter barkolensis]PKD44629.1 hypothetical protein CWD77_03980 [Rhodohalobacter barkolensis]